MREILRYSRRLAVAVISFFCLAIFAYFGRVNFYIQQALASATSTFNQTISAGSLTVDIVDGSYVAVGSPSITMGAVTFSFACQTATGTFGSATQQIYVKNPNGANNGWTVSLAASSPTDTWTDGGSNTFDFNDSTGSGCTDGGDTDTKGGQMTVDPSGGTLAVGSCSACTTGSITKGSSDAFAEGTKNSITILSAAAGSDDIGDWKLTGVSISQKIPGEQPAAAYSINMTLSIVAS